MATQKTGTDGLQGLILFIGISLGAIPLVKVLLGGEVGRLLSWFPGTGTGPGDWLVPVVVIGVCVGAIGMLERTKSQE